MILLFGSNGYIGWEFVKQLTEQKIPFIVGPHARTATMGQLESFYESVKYTHLDAVINAAGYTGKPNVDACELPANKSDVIHGNMLWVQLITDFCALNEIPLGHVSSGCIYSGRADGGIPFTEEDEPNFTFSKGNCSFYSGTKAIAEDIVRKHDDSWIWRLRIPFENNDNPRNYLSKLLNYNTLLNAENSVSNKQEFVSACISMIQTKIGFGTYNVTNSGPVDTIEVIKMINATIRPTQNFRFFDDLEDFYSRAAIAPRSNCVLSNTKLLSTGIDMKDAYDSIYYCLTHWKES